MRTRHFLIATAATGIVAAAPLHSAAAQPIEIGLALTLQGRFASTDSVLSDGSHYRIYRFRGPPGDPITITMRSSDFDAFLAGGTLQGDRFVAEDHDDDGAGGTDACIRTVVGPEGAYHIRANTLIGGATGTYTLRVDVGMADCDDPTDGMPPLEIRDIALGDTVHGRFTSAEPLLDDGTPFHVYRFVGVPGQEIVFTMRSSDFDAFLVGGAMEDGGPGMSETDDDGAGGTDARLRATVGSAGVYYIGTNAVDPGDTGTYTLIVEPAAVKSQE